MASYSTAGMRAVGPFYVPKLKAAGIRSTARLLEKARTPKGRKELAATTGIPPALILKWAKLADLMRVRGVAEDYAELLMACGVNSVKELKRRSAPRLAQSMAAENAGRKGVELLPSQKRVAGWIEEAMRLEPVIVY